MSVQLKDFDRFTEEHFLLLFLYISDEWISRTVEKVELISEVEYSHKASFQIKISEASLSSLYDQMDLIARYWANKGKDISTSKSVAKLKEKVADLMSKYFRDGRPKNVVIPLFQSNKDPLIELDISREGSPGLLEVLNREEGSDLSVDLLDLVFSLYFNTHFIAENRNIVCCITKSYPKQVLRRIKNVKDHTSFILSELDGCISDVDKDDLKKLLQEQKVQDRLDGLMQRSSEIARNIFKNDLDFTFYTHPFLLLHEYDVIFRDKSKPIGPWLLEFISDCEAYLTAFSPLASKHPDSAHFLEGFVDRYLFYVRTTALLDTPFLIKYSKRNIENRFLRRYTAGWKDTKSAIVQLQQKEDATLGTRLSLLPALNLIKRLRIYLLNYFIARMDLLGHGQSYHFEFSTKDHEIDVLTCALQYSKDGSACAGNLSKHFEVINFKSGHFHAYSAKKEFFDEKGSVIDPGNFRLILWLKIRLITPVLFCAVTFIELIGLYRLISVIDFGQLNNFIGIGVISIVGTLTIRYSPGPIVTCLIRKWRRIIVFGLALNVLGVAGCMFIIALGRAGLISILPILLCFQKICFASFLGWILYELCLGRLPVFLRGWILGILGYNIEGD